MTQSPISYNVNGLAVRDEARLSAHLQRLNPRWLLVMDSLALALTIKRMLPACSVIYRAWPDDGVPTTPPDQWVAQRKALVGDADIWVYTSNEPPATQALFDWHVRAMDAARAVGLKLVVANFAAGQPQPDAWARGHEMLRRLAAYPDQFVLGLHEYACGFILSGAPNFEALIPRDKWPTASALHGPLYHCGRYEFLLDYCYAHDLKPPRIVMTEAGFDDLNDVAAWRNTLTVTPPWSGIRGWKTLVYQWRQWWPDWGAERAYAQQLIYLWRTLYTGSPVEALLLFTWSAAANWEQFDVSAATQLQAELEEAMVTTVDVNPGVSDARWRPYNAHAAPAGTVLRQNPSVKSVRVSVLNGVVPVHHIPYEALTPAEQARADQDDGRWQLVMFDDTQAVGWARSDVLILVAAPAPEPEPEPPAPPEPSEDYGPGYNALVDKIVELQNEIRAMEARLTELIRAEVRTNEDAVLTTLARILVELINARTGEIKS